MLRVGATFTSILTKKHPAVVARMRAVFIRVSKLQRVCANDNYFDWAWQTVTFPIDIDFETGHVFKNSENPGPACLEFLRQNYSEYEVIYTDGSVEPGSGRAGCGFYAERDDFRYGLSLQLLTSVLSAELFAIRYSRFVGSRRGGSSCAASNVLPHALSLEGRYCIARGRARSRDGAC